MKDRTVQGRCPACGWATLTLGSGGYVVCGRLECPRPDAASVILADGETQHIVELGEDTFSIQHPLRERLDGALFDCELHEELTAAAGPPYRCGRYRVSDLPPRTWVAIPGDTEDDQ